LQSKDKYREKKEAPYVSSNPISKNKLRWRRGFFASVLLLTYVVLSPAPKAVAVSPPPDGGYSGDNTAEGDTALYSLTSGRANTALGSAALFSNSTGSSNTAVGVSALFSNTIGSGNTATGVNALANNTTGNFNTATGVTALFNNTTGEDNTANGDDALFANTTGSNNTANGSFALFNNTTGDANTASGDFALYLNGTGHSNTANGVDALIANTGGNANTASGAGALGSNTTGSNNTAYGTDALSSNQHGNNNIALGNLAGANLTNGSNNIDIAAPGVAGEANTIRIGTIGMQRRTFIAGISGVAVSGSEVVVNSNGRLGVATSSARFKQAIKPMDKASEAILSLKPVSFRYKEEIDPEGAPQFGLIAEDVEKVNPDLVARDAEGKVYTVRYEAVNAMLLNEFLKEHRQVQQLKATVAQQQEEFHAKFAQQQKQIEALTATIQKVSDQMKLTKAAPQIVADNQ